MNIEYYIPVQTGSESNLLHFKHLPIPKATAPDIVDIVSSEIKLHRMLIVENIKGKGRNLIFE